VLLVFLIYKGYTFWIILEFLNQPTATHGAVMRYFFGGTIFYWLLIIFLISIITMRLLAEEKRSGTIETLMTAPLKEIEVVVGKYLAALFFFIFLWVPTFFYVFILKKYADPDLGPILSGYLGNFLLGAFLISVGVFTSSLTRNQIISAVLSFLILGMLFSIGILEFITMNPKYKEFLGYLNFWHHMEDFGKGIVDTRYLVYYISMTIFFLFLSVRTLEKRKWK
jgi:ABC-2 type transport system permease protein